jgi:cullin 4
MSMQPSENSSDERYTFYTRESNPQKPTSQRKRRPSASQPAPNPGRTVSSLGYVISQPVSPLPKRQKTSHPTVRKLPGMAKSAGIISRPGIIDLTKSSKFPTHEGPKRLVIKNLRTTSQKDIDEFYDRTWADLDAALTSTFNREQPTSPLEILCRGVEAICRRGRGEELAKHVKDRCKAYLEKQLLPVIEQEIGATNVDTLRTVRKFWSLWNEQSVRIGQNISHGLTN